MHYAILSGYITGTRSTCTCCDLAFMSLPKQNLPWISDKLEVSLRQLSIGCAQRFAEATCLATYQLATCSRSAIATSLHVHSYSQLARYVQYRQMQTEATAAATCRARTLRTVAPPLFRPQLALVGLRCTCSVLAGRRRKHELRKYQHHHQFVLKLQQLAGAMKTIEAMLCSAKAMMATRQRVTFSRPVLQQPCPGI